ncbi:MAG: DUF4245 family protein [Leucobacter sp.]
MARTQKPPTVVAELGRPETAEETAARKAKDSRLYRQRKTVNNLVFSLLVTVGAVLLIVLMVPRGVGGFEDLTVDVAATAADTSASIERALVAPEVPEDWKAKQAKLRSDGDVTSWYIGYTTSGGAYAAVVQAFNPNGGEVGERWIAEQLEAQSATGVEQIGGIEWTVYDHPERSPDGANMVFGLEGAVGDTALLVYGTDRPEVLRDLAASVAASMNTPEGGK